ncbi:MAG: zinc transporter ZntB [Desulforhopalus sp.]
MAKNGLIHAFILDGSGGGRRLNWEEIGLWSPAQGILWIHLSYNGFDAATWIQEKSGLDPVVAEALLSEETRPRSTIIDNGLLMTLRGVNLNPGSDHEDMVSVRIWAEKEMIITTRKRKLLSVTNIADSLDAGRGPCTSSQFINMLAEFLTLNIEGTIDVIESHTAELEEQVGDFQNRSLRAEITGLRRKAIMLRRYLAPQREALIRLHADNLPWFNEGDRRQLHETANSLIRIVEDLDSIRDRALVAQEELINIVSEQMNSRMYTLSLVTAIFLPLSFLTGLLGINVGGIPGSQSDLAFLAFLILLLLIFLGQLFYFRKKRWI